jgi:hypothetical protein
MVFIQIYDALARTSIYTDPPFFIEAIRTVTPWPPSILFSFVSGMSVYLLINKCLRTKTKNETTKKVLITYGKYILISLPFTVFMWDLTTYFQWNEAIQGIGLSAIIIALILIYLKPKKLELLISIPLITLARHFIQSSKLGELLPYSPPLNEPLTIIGSSLINMLYRGWFSVLNLIPLMLAGILFYKATIKGFSKELIVISSTILAVSLILNFTLMPIDYYTKSINMTLYGIGICSVTFSLLLLAYERKARLTNALTIAGMSTLFLYLGHNLLLLKWVYLFAKDSLPEWLALLLASGLTVLFYYLAKLKLSIKQRNVYNQKKAKNLTNE